AERRIVYSPVELVRPCSIREDALDTSRDFGGGLLFANHCRQATSDLFATLGQIFRDVVKHLRAGVRCGLAPPGSLVCCLDCVANVFSIAERGLAQKTSIGGSYFHAVPRVRPRLIAADIQFYGTVDGGRDRSRIVG